MVSRNRRSAAGFFIFAAVLLVELSSSLRIGELVMEALQRLDRVAYVRYASVYRNFQDAGEFRDAVDELDSRQEREKLALNQVSIRI